MYWCVVIYYLRFSMFCSQIICMLSFYSLLTEIPHCHAHLYRSLHCLSFASFLGLSM
ncbi:hypothetical protein HETIRDRAFT_163289 [Heterobasidion irregulare TC 32-1]|uniref:Uncharacterized protein n=1 Tax=Heterobasidion irregulare (strain TC 32-1) TaxID=747525 RepID=W4KCT8_HETIT|nr:uncharacterized protein HETIRDRAFT_163289 [Heterobasidion irregulare TC 32-1]ETW82876.1 hypothetical protein HETIRDRAFT_163289 [Heterobasidion irregulare TC 32-1]